MKQYLHKPYFENLDALRFFAFLNVFLCHCVGIFNYSFSNKYVNLLQQHFFTNGGLGVSFFFVLSGFLITWLLLLEKGENTKIDVRAFYMRRILRIWPVYFLVVLVGIAVALAGPFTLLEQNNFNYRFDLSQLKWYLLFLANNEILLHGTFSSLILGVLWSVSVEEQFYLMWPLLFLFLKNRAVPFVCIFVIVISFIFRCISTNPNAHYSTFGVMSFLAVGGLVAWLSRHRPAFTSFFKTLGRSYIVFIYILFFLYIPAIGFAHVFGEHVFALYQPFEGLILAFFFGFIILEQIYCENSFVKFGKLSVLTRLGKISYGLYAYHILSFPIVFYLVDKLTIPDHFTGYITKIFFAFLLTVLFSTLSYRFMEKKVLSLKKYFQPRLLAVKQTTTG